MSKETYSDFFRDFKTPYQPKYAFCPLSFITYIMRYYEVDYAKANEIYMKVSTHYGAISHMNDFLYEELFLKK